MKAMQMTLCSCTHEYWEFVRQLRTDERVQQGFITQADISSAQQEKYMEARWREYFVALVDGQPAGFVGSVDGDIRVCTHPDYQHRGVATFMISELMRRFPSAIAKVKFSNEPSRRLFEKCGFMPILVIYERQVPT
jgi:GNAT superfamily N-acetyltransferase